MIRFLSIPFCVLAVPATAGTLLLNPPLDCDLSGPCYIQQYVDRDPGKGAADFTCGTLSYDGHKGTDFALPSLAMMESGVDVIAAAPGTVVATRDGVADVNYREIDPATVDGQECGNGVLVRHGDGWETQYCHLKNGSVTVRKGQKVAKGTVLGQVGLSGKTEFPHVHLSVRQHGAVVDPFSPAAGPALCGAPPETPLWQHEVPYRPAGIITVGVADAVPEYAAIKAGAAYATDLKTDAPAMVVWGYFFGGRKGDLLTIRIEGPNGTLFSNDVIQKADQAQFFRAGGKRNSAGRWPAGDYRGVVTIARDGTVLDRGTVAFTVSD